MKNLFKLLFLFLIGLVSTVQTIASAHYKPCYNVENEWIVGYNLDRYNNRPLYINNTNAFILTGDKPVARLAKDEKLFGTFGLVFERDGVHKPLHEFDRIKSMYAFGRMKWELADSKLNGIKVRMEVLPVTLGLGMAFRIEASGFNSSDKLHWSLTGAKNYGDERLSWIFDAMGHPEILKWGVDSGDSVLLKGDFSTGGKEDYLALEVSADGGMVGCFNKKAKSLYEEGRRKLEALCGRIKVNTPDQYLNAIASSSVRSVDGNWYPPVFVHGCMQWNKALPGWRSIFGGTVYGWHDRVMEEAKYYIDHQIRESDKRLPKADPALLLTGQHADSRFYGVGRIDKDQDFYDMQSQFFDQIIEEYKWTNDPELVSFLRPALELHLKWMEECFDPDGDGTYESYMNAWPTDSQWYNGGGTAEETSYAYRGHLAAYDMAFNAGDTLSAKHHSEMLERIKAGFFSSLWMQSKGHSGAYREQGGNRRLHENPWLYSIFLPIDAGLTSPLQNIESVYYTEWALQNDKMPAGGRKVWSSNWIPAIWSVRELWAGDNYHLALSYFLSGLSGDGWDIMKGSFMHSAFDHLVPGNLGSVQGGIDFGDCVHTFARTLVSGLFGYRPDYPKGQVTFSPGFPAEWENASIELPDFKLGFRKDELKVNYVFELAKKAGMELLLPVRCTDIEKVTVNGKRVEWELLPGVGGSIVKVLLPESTKADVVILMKDELPFYEVRDLEFDINQKAVFTVENGMVKELLDPQKVFDRVNCKGSELRADVLDNKGNHTVVALVEAGKAPQWRVFRVKIKDPSGDVLRKAEVVREIPFFADWETLNISSLYNADVTAIYKQKYLTPRMNTVSLRIGTDGYSPWTFPYWQSLPPTITLEVDQLKEPGNRLITPQGVPFHWHTDKNNILFTSLWDNYPDKVNIPVGKSGDAIFFLVCGSTNVMQCSIANAVIYINYEDGKRDSLELIPPVNYWNLSVIDSQATVAGQDGRIYYNSDVDRFCMPEEMPQTVELGQNCTAMLLNKRLREGKPVKSVTLETLSQEVVVGLMGITLMKKE